MRVLSWAFGTFLLAGTGVAFALAPKGLVDQAGYEAPPLADVAEQAAEASEAPLTGARQTLLPKAALPGVEGLHVPEAPIHIAVKPLAPAATAPSSETAGSPSPAEGVVVRVYKRGRNGYRVIPRIEVSGRLLPDKTLVLLENGRTFVSLDGAFLRLMSLQLVRDFRAGRQSAFLVRGSSWLKFTEGVDRIAYSRKEARQKPTDTPFRFSGRLMVPFRDVAEVFGYQVGWDASAKKVVAFA